MALSSALACPSVGSGVGASARPSAVCCCQEQHDEEPPHGEAARCQGNGSAQVVWLSGACVRARRSFRLPHKIRACCAPPGAPCALLCRGPLGGKQRDCWTGWGLPLRRWRAELRGLKNAQSSRLRCAVSRLGCPTALIRRLHCGGAANTARQAHHKRPRTAAAARPGHERPHQHHAHDAAPPPIKGP